MGQCIGTKSLEQEIKQTQNENAALAVEVIKMQDEIDKVRDEFYHYQSYIAETLQQRASDDVDRNDAIDAREKITESHLLELKKSIVGFHREMKSYGEAYELVASDMNYLSRRREVSSHSIHVELDKSEGVASQ